MARLGGRISQILIKGVTGSSTELLVAWESPSLPAPVEAMQSTLHPAHTIHEQIKLWKREKIAKFMCNSQALNLATGTAAFAKANRNSCKIKASSPFLEKERAGGEEIRERRKDRQKDGCEVGEEDRALLLAGCMFRSASVPLWCLGAMSLQPLAGCP